jgi:hypothetical protein
MPFPVMLRPGSWPLIEDRFPAFRDAPNYKRWGTNVRFLTPVHATGPARITALVFVGHEAGAETQLAELSVLDSLLALQRSGFWVEHTPDSIERFLAWLAGIRRYNLRYAELEEAEAIIGELAANAPPALAYPPQALIAKTRTSSSFGARSPSKRSPTLVRRQESPMDS